ncbi:S-adenosyl-L-methionine-dependent methyltransferase [Lizonia empirigonia]|nr:S-adenosyl-L-methionine-dependent methyltransferase [Lizonia empirigonia]
MLVACSYLPSTIRHLYNTNGLSSIFSWGKLQSAWFSEFWAWAGPRIREANGPRITALLEGRVTGGQLVDEVVGEPISGVVLDIGPGLGYLVDLYARADVPIADSGDSVRQRAGKGQGITKVYGVEPNSQSHSGLRKRAKAAGLDGVYEILPVGIEDIAKETVVKKGSVDAIVSVLCICSIPEPEKNIKELHSYLKPGGKWYLYEHVAVKNHWPMKIYQSKSILSTSSSTFSGHTHLAAASFAGTQKTLREAGPWSRVDLTQPPEEPWHQTVPHILGTLTK